MVGVPRSKGCSLCVRRRVKCDQVHPACGNCVRYGAECPGYERDLKFVSGKHAVRSKRATARRGGPHHHVLLDLASNSASASASASEVGSSGPATPAPGRTSSPTRALVRVSDGGGDDDDDAAAHGRRTVSLKLTTTTTITDSLRQNCVPLIYGMMGQLFSIHSRDELVYTAPWFSSVLHYLGQEPVLDSAMSALMLQMLGKAKGDAGALDINRGRDLYGRALARLQRALNHPTAWKAVETLAATIVCCLYELFAGTTNPLAWMVHAGGVGKLVLARGPGSFETPFEKALLRGARPILITKSIFTGEDCFLKRPKWRKISSHLTTDETGRETPGPPESARVSMPRWNRYHDAYFVILARIPGVVAAGYNMREWRRHGIKPGAAQAAQVEQETSSLRREYLAWYDGAVREGGILLPTEVPSEDPTSPFETVFRFANPWVGSFCVHYWATLLVLQECLDQCQDDVANRLYRQDNQELSTNILRSLEYVGQGLMGPYRVGYSLRIIVDFLDPPRRAWLFSVISRYNKHFASVSSEVYPDHPAHLGDGGEEEEAAAAAAKDEEAGRRRPPEANTLS